MLWAVLSVFIEKESDAQTHAPRGPMTLFWITKTAHSSSEEDFFCYLGQYIAALIR